MKGDGDRRKSGGARKMDFYSILRSYFYLWNRRFYSLKDCWLRIRIIKYFFFLCITLISFNFFLN